MMDDARITLDSDERREITHALQHPDRDGVAPARALRLVEIRADMPESRSIVLTGNFREEVRRALQTGDREAIRRCLSEVENAYELRTSSAGRRELAV